MSFRGPPSVSEGHEELQVSLVTKSRSDTQSPVALEDSEVPRRPSLREGLARDDMLARSFMKGNGRWSSRRSGSTL
jgi:hypothetical protein